MKYIKVLLGTLVFLAFILISFFFGIIYTMEKVFSNPVYYIELLQKEIDNNYNS